MTDPEAASAFIAGILALLGVLAVHGLLMLGRHRQRGTDRWRSEFEGAFDDGIRYGMRRAERTVRDRHNLDAIYHRPIERYARGAYPLTPMPPESPAQRQLREWQERLDAQ